VNLLKNSPIPDDQLLANLAIYLSRPLFTRIMFMHELYKKIINVHGDIMEFGVRWGQNMSLFHVFKGIYEPYNFHRKIIGFDTFEGFPSIHKNDGDAAEVHIGSMSVSDQYEEYLEQILDFHVDVNPLSHLHQYKLIKGDATKTIHEYLAKNPETMIAFAYFDFDIYEPTKVCLEAIKPHLNRGSVIGFDELAVHKWPGEILAFREVFGENNFSVRRSQYTPYETYIVFE
jgi:hypothetical protein